MMDLTAYELYLERGGRKYSTVKSHLDTVQYLYRVKKDWDNSVDSFNAALLTLRRKGLKNNTLNRLIDSVKVYAHFSNRDEFLQVPHFKESAVNKATLSDEEILKILDLPRLKNSGQKQWNEMTMFFAILAYTGARPGEIAKLSIDTVDFGINRLILLDTKTGDVRKVPIHEALKEKYGLIDYVRSCDDYLFPCKRGGKNREGLPCIGVNEWGHNFRRRIEALGIKRTNLTVYSLRHSVITSLIDADVNIFKIGDLVGHKRIETTAVYTHLSSKHLEKVIQALPIGLTEISPEKTLQRVREIIGPLIEKDPRLSWEYSESGISIKIK